MDLAKILVVDDEIIIARELEARLTSMGYDVSGIASSGEEAIRMALEIRPDLILMDIVLKGELDGIEAATEIRKHFVTPIIFVTAYTDKKTLERASAADAFAYIVKPFSERELNANIHMALYKHRMDTRSRRIEQWFVNAIAHSDDAVIASDAEGRITTFTDAAAAITSWPKDEAMGQKLHDVLRLVGRGHRNPVALDDLAEGPAVSLSDTTLLVDRQDNPIPVDATSIYLRDEADRPTGTLSVIRDASGQPHRKLAALTSDVAMAVAQSLTMRGMLQMCTESIVRNLNAAFARVWTLNPTGDYLLLQASAGLYTHLDGDHSKIPVGKFKIGKIAEERLPHLTNDVLHDERVSDQKWAKEEGMVSFAGYPLIVEERLVGVLAMFARQEMTQHVLDSLGAVARTISVGIERKQLEDQIRHSQKIDAIGRLAGGVAHDFNNLLTIITGYGDCLMRTPVLDAETKEMLGEILKAGSRAASLTRQLLTFSRRQFLEPTVIDLNDLIVEMSRMLQRLIGEDIELKIDCNPSLKQISADAGQIEQVIVNLAVNARDAMTNGGEIVITTRNAVLDERYAQMHPDVVPGEYVLLTVSDSGTGMSQDTLAHIFEPFFTTKELGKGTGLGLATVYGIVKQSGGHISVTSELGVGSTFSVYLPVTTSKASKAESEDSVELPAGLETILLVEDEAAVRVLAGRILRARGYTVLEESNGQNALDLVANCPDKIDLVLTDVVMPVMSGVALVERLRAMRPTIKVLYMSGYTDDSVLRSGLDRANIALIQKPFAPAALAKHVREVLDKH